MDLASSIRHTISIVSSLRIASFFLVDDTERNMLMSFLIPPLNALGRFCGSQRPHTVSMTITLLGTARAVSYHSFLVKLSFVQNIIIWPGVCYTFYHRSC